MSQVPCLAADNYPSHRLCRPYPRRHQMQLLHPPWPPLPAYTMRPHYLWSARNLDLERNHRGKSSRPSLLWMIGGKSRGLASRPPRFLGPPQSPPPSPLFPTSTPLCLS